jgi:hypothetical protein
MDPEGDTHRTPAEVLAGDNIRAAAAADRIDSACRSPFREHRWDGGLYQDYWECRGAETESRTGAEPAKPSNWNRRGPIRGLEAADWLFPAQGRCQRQKRG